MIKTFQKVSTEEYISKEQRPYVKNTQYYIQLRKVERFPSKIRRSGTKQGCPLLPLFQHTMEHAGHNNQARKEKQRHVNWKGSTTTVAVCRWHDIIYRKPQRLY